MFCNFIKYSQQEARNIDNARLVFGTLEKKIVTEVIHYI